MAELQQKPLVRLIEEIRACSGLMAGIAHRAHEDLGITASQRAVLEILQRTGPRTVPDMARTRNVSRQHVQKTVDGLSAQGLVGLQPNPAHKRSPIIALSARGKQLFATIGHREKTILEQLEASLEDADITGAVHVLKAFTEALRRLDPSQAI